MGFPLAVIQPSPLQRCARGGACCRLIPLTISPATLRRIYESYIDHRDSMPKAGVPGEDDILAVGPMLDGRCKGKVRIGTVEGVATLFQPDEPYGEMRYIFGPCANLVADADGNFGCQIHHAKPMMCAEYPWTRSFHLDSQRGVYQSNDAQNPGVFRGCGFNLNPLSGISEREVIAALIPLEDEEK